MSFSQHHRQYHKRSCPLAVCSKTPMANILLQSVTLRSESMPTHLFENDQLIVYIKSISPEAMEIAAIIVAVNYVSIAELALSMA